LVREALLVALSARVISASVTVAKIASAANPRLVLAVAALSKSDKLLAASKSPPPDSAASSKAVAPALTLRTFNPLTT